MATLSFTKVAVALGGLAVSLSAGMGTASADPDPVNTTCTYPQVVAALNAQDPAAAEQLNSSPMAQGYVRRFLASPPAKRQQMISQLQGSPQGQQYLATINELAATCNNY